MKTVIIVAAVISIIVLIDIFIFALFCADTHSHDEWDDDDQERFLREWKDKKIRRDNSTNTGEGKARSSGHCAETGEYTEE